MLSSVTDLFAFESPVTAFAVLFPLCIILLLVYLVPSLVAFHRFHENKFGVLLVNFLTGWTVIGWIVCMVWSLRD